MVQDETAVAGDRTTLRKIVDFPLVAMVTAILLYAFAAAAAITVGQSLPLLDPDAVMVAKASLTIAALAAMYKFVIVRLGERHHDDLPARHALRDLGLGIALGALIFSLVVGVAAAADVYKIVGKGSTADFIPALVLTAIVPGFTEELLFRGILFRWIEEFAGSWVALILTSLLFGFAHGWNPNATWFSSFAIAVEAGLLLGGAYMLTRSLWLPIGLHAAWNFTQGFIYDVPVSGIATNGLVDARLSGPELLSGGRFGLEASIFAVAIATAVGVILIRLAWKRGELMRPWWERRRAADKAAA